MSQKIRFGLIWQMTLSFGILAILTISLYGGMNYRRNRLDLENRILSNMDFRTSVSAKEIDSWLLTRIVALESKADNYRIKPTLDLTRTGGLSNNPFLSWDESTCGISECYIGTPEKKFYFGGDWLAPDDFDPTSRPWYQSAVKEKKTIITDYYTDAITGNLTITIATPLFDVRDKTLLGVLGIDLFLDDMLGLLNSTVLEEGSSLALIDDKGVTIAHPNEELIGKSVLDLLDDGGNPFMSPVIISPSGHQLYSFQRTEKAMVWQTTDRLGWKVVLFVPEEIMYAPLIALRNQIIIYIIISQVIFGTLVFFSSLYFVTRIKRVSLTLGEISDGEGDLTQSLKENNNDELTDLTANFNRFVRVIHDMIANIKQSANTTLSAKDTLVTNTEETAAAIDEISATMNSMEHQIKRLDSVIDNSSQSMKSISGSLDSFSGIRQEQAAIVEETAASIEQMLKSLQKVSEITQEKKEIATRLTETSRRGGDQLNTMNRIFNVKVVEKLESIENMTNIIRGIASQINLLSMNAAIEAAHAGDAGRGFAVVADEIRKLAESSSESVKTIDSVIGEIRVGVEDTAENSKETAQVFHEMDRVITDFVDALNLIANSTSELMLGSREIGSTSARLNEITLAIKNGAAVIDTGATELENELEAIQEISKTVLDGIHEAAIGTGDIVRAMVQVTTLSQELADTSNELKTRINRFKTDE
ncbi:MAG: methyl-accepting chemotaxis protein [Spirochaetales bacterium]|nr:methyl-accepting chemotaxis protein [Spirochaetales bacterium]